MKIALLAGANSIHTVRWANALLHRGCQVHLFTQHSPLPSLAAAVCVERLPYRGPWGYWFNVRALRRSLLRLQPDVLHAHYASGYGTLGRLCGYRPWLLSVWGSDVFEFPRRSAWHRRLLRDNLSAADAVCSTSRTMAEETRRICPGLPRITILPFGVDLAGFCLPRTVSHKSEFVVGTVKTLLPTYGIDVLLRGFASFRRRAVKTFSRSLRLRVVGEGPQRRALERLARRLDIEDCTEMLGSAAHARVPSLLQGFDVFVAMSRQESFGVAVAEASAAGLPVVASNVGGLPEVVVDGETGFLVQSGDAEALAGCLDRLLADEALRDRMGAAGREFVARHFDWEDSVTQMMSIYGQLREARN